MWELLNLFLNSTPFWLGSVLHEEFSSWEKNNYRIWSFVFIYIQACIEKDFNFHYRLVYYDIFRPCDIVKISNHSKTIVDVCDIWILQEAQHGEYKVTFSRMLTLVRSLSWYHSTFDTIDHDILIDSISLVGILEIAFNWFLSNFV